MEDYQRNAPQPLPEDNDTPFSPPDDVTDDMADPNEENRESPALEPTHQSTDPDIDAHELYDEGLSGAVEAEEPNKNSAVTGFTPPDDEETEHKAF